MDGKSIYECRHCGDYYCADCTDHKDWQIYCSEECSKEAKNNG